MKFHTKQSGSAIEDSPFGGHAKLVQQLPVRALEDMYKQKCELDVSQYLDGLAYISQYKCRKTGMLFWRPKEISGDEAFYAEISKKWPSYYKEERWEYHQARNQIIHSQAESILEIGCGRGYFLRSLEPLGVNGVGLELNKDAIHNKETKSQVLQQTLQDFRSHNPHSIDAVCSFQVLEHVCDPYQFLSDCVDVVKPGGKIIISTPNHEYPDHAMMRDAFDLPPHHLNHFNRRVFQRIGKILSLRIVGIYSQPHNLGVHTNDRKPNLFTHLASRALSHGWQAANQLIGQTTSNPRVGHTILAIFQKP
ncbi:class I SAM-dependent methyltransferase [Cyanobium gracile]|uniref:Methyltransferase domain-containing protein n=1 Tax=Cyanobium gracile UHCC 0281 TaxID=3110309 RepID=A0ABU5STQ7_9CYAN|nr:methyltransferase domain-containing protein [Cyanobium gracile]MEA5441880.1 methyltransferase domain-containing protein [Cyanobium gracile UHCC 0281]